MVAITKYIGFFLSGSSAMLAESVHSTAVTLNQALMLQGQLAARRPATRLHPFGFGQIRYFWAFVVSVLIFGIGAVISVGRGVLALAGGEGETLAGPTSPSRRSPSACSWTEARSSSVCARPSGRRAS